MPNFMNKKLTEYRFWPSILSLPLGIIAAVMARYAVTLPGLYEGFVTGHPRVRGPFIEAGIPGLVHFFVLVVGVGAVVGLVASLAALFPRRWTLRLVRGGYMAVWLVFAFFAQVIFRATGVILAGNISIDGVPPVPVTLFYWRYDLLLPAGVVVLVLAGLYLCSWRRKVINLYTGMQDELPAPGDRILENIRTHGRDPLYRKSVWASFGLHILIIVLIPWLLTFGGCVEPYRVPKGSGTPQVAGPQVVVKTKKVKKKKKRFMLNPQSAISFHIPDLEDSDVSRKVEAESQLTYVADPNRMTGTGTGGKTGAGGGKTGGWPDGMENAKVRFIRMEYGGQGWDDGMDAVSRADMNFLDSFKKLTGFNVAAESESHPISRLTKYPKGMAPPFVYMTGSEDIRVSDRDVAVMREYLMGGGMLFADCRSTRWDPQFRNLAQRIFPGEPLTTIADDDPIFQCPFAFANGAPPLWHHGGMRAQGVKYKGRWAIFYHPGGIGDAWKTGHMGMDAALAQGSIEMGVNIVYYSFTQYLKLTSKDRK